MRERSEGLSVSSNNEPAASGYDPPVVVPMSRTREASSPATPGEAWQALQNAVLSGSAQTAADALEILASTLDGLETLLANSNLQGTEAMPQTHQAQSVREQSAMVALIDETRFHLQDQRLWEESILHLAARAAIDMGEDSEMQDMPLHERLVIVKALLSMSADPNAGDVRQDTPLMEAACAGDLDVCRLLLDFNADALAVSRSGLCAADYAGSHPEVAALLSSSVSRPCTGEASTRLALLGRETEQALDTLQALLVEGAGGREGDQVDLAIRSLQNAVDSYARDNSCSDRSYGAALRARNGEGWLLLQLCQALGCASPSGKAAEAVRWLLDDKAAVNVVTELGETPLALAVRAGARGKSAPSLAAARALLEAEADPNASDNSGECPLMEAVLGGDAELVELLLDAGAEGLVAPEYRI